MELGLRWNWVWNGVRICGWLGGFAIGPGQLGRGRLRSLVAAGRRGCGSRWRRGFFDEDGPAGEGKVAGIVVDYVHLARREARLQGLQRQVDLEDDGFAVGGGYFVGHD